MQAAVIAQVRTITNMNEETEPLISSLNGVVGQTRAVAVLRTALDAYFNDRSRRDESWHFRTF